MLDAGESAQIRHDLIKPHCFRIDRCEIDTVEPEALSAHLRHRCPTADVVLPVTIDQPSHIRSVRCLPVVPEPFRDPGHLNAQCVENSGHWFWFRRQFGI